MNGGVFDVQVPATELQIAEAIRWADDFAANVIRRLAYERDILRGESDLYRRGYEAMQAADISEYLALCASVKKSDDDRETIQEADAYERAALIVETGGESSGLPADERLELAIQVGPNAALAALIRRLKCQTATSTTGADAAAPNTSSEPCT